MNTDSLNDSKTDETAFTMKKTGDTKSVADQSCQVWVIKSRGEQFNVCMARDLGSFMMPGNPVGGARNIPRWAREAINEGVMPLEVIRIKSDQTNIQMRATRIEQKSMDSSLFEIPDGYKDLSGMLKQMMDRNRN